MCPTVEDLPIGWQVKRLASFCTKIGTGATPRGGSEVYLNSRVSHALVRSQHVFDRQFESAGLAFISDSQAKELRNAEVQSGDVLLNITGDGVSFGRACIVPDRVLPACVNQHVSIIRPDRRECDPGYLLSVLTHPATKGYIESFNSGGSRRAITKGHIESFEIPLPPLAEQKAIAAVLGTLDDKIELNRRMNATLEAMARALFQSWFVDFDPVRAKLDGRKPAGLDAASAALFLASFQNSPLGPIPHGWTVTTLGEACEQGGGNIQTGPFGTQLHASDYVVEGVPSIMPSDLRDNRIDTSSIARIREQDAERLGAFRVQTGDVVYSRRGDVERRSLIRRSEDGWLCGTGCLRVRFGPNGLNRFFGASYLGTLESRTWVVRHAVGATMPNLNTSILGALPMIVPPVELQARFAEIVGPWDECGTIALDQSHTLATLRDTLLPKLLSGELSVISVTKEVSA
jgi:type I restriction enzyme S subunit